MRQARACWPVLVKKANDEVLQLQTELGQRKEPLTYWSTIGNKAVQGGTARKLEQLRYLEFGKRIKMVETTHVGIGIDTPEDLEKARLLL